MQDAFEERLQDNRTTPVPDQVAFRVDWPQFFTSLTTRDQQMAEFLSKVVIDSDPYLSIETEAIVLRGIDLGRFSVQLHWQRLLQTAEVDCFEIVALDPHPAASDEAVTHPHVKSNRLCPGSAETPLRKALQQGRFTDAFTLICSMLRHRTTLAVPMCP